MLISQTEQKKTTVSHPVDINWKKVKIGVIIVVIVAIVIGGIVFALNFKKMQINKANKLIKQTQYSEALKVLEKYKDDDDVNFLIILLIKKYMIIYIALDKQLKSLDYYATKRSITNTTEYTFDYFGLNIQCLDDSKNIIDQAYTGQIKSFAHGQTAALEFTTDKSPSSFHVEAEYSIKGE